MNRRTSGASLLYAGTSPARWFRTAATIAEGWGSSLCALQWHASRALRDRPAMAQPAIGEPLISTPALDQRAPVRVRYERE